MANGVVHFEIIGADGPALEKFYVDRQDRIAVRICGLLQHPPMGSSDRALAPQVVAFRGDVSAGRSIGSSGAWSRTPVPIVSDSSGSASGMSCRPR